MANISEYLAKIKSAIYGEEVRDSIHDAIAEINKESINAEAVAISSRDSARHQADRSETNANQSQAWAEGKINGEDVSPESAQYKNNAKYWAGYAQHYAEGGVRWKGSITFAEIPTEDMVIGDMYSITNKFVTDERFEYGAGEKCPAGTNIIYREDGLWDLSPSTISGYSDAVFDTLDEAQQHLDELEIGQTIYVKQARADAYSANLAPIQKRTIATQKYLSGRRFVINRVLYRATADINIGDTIVVGTNCVKTTVDEELASLYTDISQIVSELLEFDVDGTKIPEGTTVGEFCTLLANRFYPNALWVYHDGLVENINWAGSGWGNAGSYLYVSTHTSAVCYSAITFDLTNYQTIHFRGSIGVRENTGGSGYFGVAKAQGGSVARHGSHSTSNYQTATVVDDVDISDLTGLYYVQFGCSSGRPNEYGYQATVTRIWLD